MELTFDRLTKKFHSTIAVDRFSYTMSNGVYGLLGANGAGKTTLMRMICTILQPTGGEILYNGNRIHSMGAKYCDILGYLPQNFGYYPDFSAQDFMLYMASLKGIHGRAASRKVRELLEIVGLSEVSGQKIRAFSGGMKQRLGIAQAVLNNPKVLVLDEPTAGLDPKERIRFRNLISDLSQDKIVILSTHIVSDVEYIADQILMMKKGHVIGSGTPAHLLESISNKVKELPCSPDYLEQMEQEYAVGNVFQRNGETWIRVVGDHLPEKGHEVPEHLTLEDVYLYYLGA